MTGKLLFVDADDSSRRLVETALANEGIDVSVAGDAAVVLDRVSTDRPDLVVLGVPQPGIDSLELLERIRSAEPALPVIVLASASDGKTAIRAVRAGASHFLNKPIDEEALVAVVHRALETRALRAEVDELRLRVKQLCSSVAPVDHTDAAAPVPQAGMSLRATAEEAARHAERIAIVNALQVTRGNKSQAAKALKTDYKTLHVKMKALKIRAHDFKIH